MKRTARAKRHPGRTSRRLPRKTNKTRVIVFVVLALFAFFAGFFILNNPLYPKAEALTPTANISVTLVKPEDGQIVTRLANPVRISATSKLWITRYDFLMDDVFQGSIVNEINPRVTPTPNPNGLYHVDFTTPNFFQTHNIPENTWHTLKVRAIDKDMNYADSPPVRVYIRNGLEYVITPTISVGTPSANFIQNPGFETDDNLDTLPDKWGTIKYFTRTKNVVHSGAYAGMHSTPFSTDYGIVQKFWGIQGGKSYTVSNWIYVPTSMKNFHYSIRLHWKKANDDHISMVTPKRIGQATGGWIQLKDTVRAPAQAAAVIVEMHMENLNGTIYVDDFEFKQL